MRRTLIVLCLSLLTLTSRPTAKPAEADATLAISEVNSVGFTVGDMERALAFYTGVLPFVKESDVEVSGRKYELLTGVFGARARIVSLRLGAEVIELTEFLAPKGRAMPGDVRANDRVFQHIAIVVSELGKAYALLRNANVLHASTGPQVLPDWNPDAGGIGAFYFRDPDDHFLEVISFPRGKGSPRWQVTDGPLFLGIDHTAIVVDNTDNSLRFYRDTLGFSIAGTSENHDVEQEHLNNVFGARLRITALRVAHGPGIELLEYLAPRDGRPAPPDLRANDIAHWQTTLVAPRMEPLLPLARMHLIALVSPGPVTDLSPVAFRVGALTRDPDGHGLRLVSR